MTDQRHTTAPTDIDDLSPETGGASADRPDDVETWVPEGAHAVRCSYCGRPFAAEQLLALHRGLAHGESLNDAEREAFVEATAAERADIRRFRIVALGALVVLYFGLLFGYAAFA
jgi:hypothetical protein